MDRNLGRGEQVQKLIKELEQSTRLRFQKGSVFLEKESSPYWDIQSLKNAIGLVIIKTLIQFLDSDFGLVADTGAEDGDLNTVYISNAVDMEVQHLYSGKTMEFLRPMPQLYEQELKQIRKIFEKYV